jgi:hypothetical protein
MPIMVDMIFSIKVSRSGILFSSSDQLRKEYNVSIMLRKLNLTLMVTVKHGEHLKKRIKRVNFVLLLFQTLSSQRHFDLLAVVYNYGPAVRPKLLHSILCDSRLTVSAKPNYSRTCSVRCGRLLTSLPLSHSAKHHWHFEFGRYRYHPLNPLYLTQIY